jgi:NAD(P)-dependent dehydrogenase (short-subunit alcohol dehydrogenase family)
VVYNGTCAFLPLLQKAEADRIVNPSRINGFWASIGPPIPRRKFAVKGFTKALIADLQIHTPHVKCSLDAPPYRNLDPAQHSQGAEPQMGGCDGRDAAGSSTVALCLEGQRRLGHVGR